MSDDLANAPGWDWARVPDYLLVQRAKQWRAHLPVKRVPRSWISEIAIAQVPSITAEMKRRGLTDE